MRKYKTVLQVKGELIPFPVPSVFPVIDMVGSVVAQMTFLAKRFQVVKPVIGLIMIQMRHR